METFLFRGLDFRAEINTSNAYIGIVYYVHCLTHKFGIHQGIC